MAVGALLRLLLLMVVSLFSSGVYLFVSWLKGVLGHADPFRRSRRKKEMIMREARSFAEWQSDALEVDRMRGRTAWKADPGSPWYDSHAIATRLRQLREAHHAGDRDTAMMLVRENLDRGLAGLGNPLLYTHCTTGTKNLIEEYVAEMVLQLERLAAAPGDVADLIPIERSLADGRQAYGRTALLLSGGLSFGMCHWGVAKCLFEQQLLPPIISGASIGALVAALLGAHTDDELATMFRDGVLINFEAFEKLAPGSGIRKLKRFLKHGVLNDVGKLEDLCRTNLGDLTFAESFKLTGRVISISITHPSDPLLPTLLNHVPGLFPAVPLKMKNMAGDIVPVRQNKGKHTRRHSGQGSKAKVDLPMRRLSELFNVNHFIVSQVNPHIVPFLRASKSNSRFSFLHRAVMFMGKEVIHWLRQLTDLMFWPRALRWLREDLDQTYQGDITIVPQLSLSAMTHMTSNPNGRVMERYTREGERSTYRYISMIRARCSIEIALRQCTTKIRDRLSELDPKWGPPTPATPRRTTGRGTPTTDDHIPQRHRHTPPSPLPVFGATSPSGSAKRPRAPTSSRDLTGLPSSNMTSWASSGAGTLTGYPRSVFFGPRAPSSKGVEFAARPGAESPTAVD